LNSDALVGTNLQLEKHLLAVAGYGRRHYRPTGVKRPLSTWRWSATAFRRQRIFIAITCLGQGVVPHTHTLRREPGRRRAVEGQMRVMVFLRGLPHAAFFRECIVMFFYT